MIKLNPLHHVPASNGTNALPPHGGEAHLLLSTLDLALARIALAESSGDGEQSTRHLARALDAYGSVKGLLPKLGLRSEQVAVVQERLNAVKQRLALHSKRPDPTST
jgi:hypothetical protein